MADDGRRGTVLVVEADDEERDRYGTWLEESGFDVLSCPGPTEPDYTCVGARDGVCPLVEEADVVILDMSLESEAVLVGTAAEEILGMYLFMGSRIVALGSHPGDEVHGQLLRLHRHPERDQLMEAVVLLAAGPEVPPET
jgi:hypothetical protein